MMTKRLELGSFDGGDYDEHNGVGFKEISGIFTTREDFLKLGLCHLRESSKWL